MAEPGAKRLHESSLGHVLVGLFVVVVSIGLGWLLVELRSGPERYSLIAEFDALGNISEATQVKLRGYNVGQVDGIEFRHSPKPGEAFFLVEMGVTKGVPIPQGTVAEIRGSGLVGEAYIELVPPAQPAGSLPPGSHLQGLRDAGMKTLTTRLTEAATKLGGAGATLRDARIGERLGELNRDVARIADQMVIVGQSTDSLLQTSRSLVTGLQPSVMRSLESLDRSMAQVAVILSRADTLVSSSDEDVHEAIRSLQKVAAHLESVLQRVDTLMARKEGQIDSTLSNLHQTSQSLRELSVSPLKAVTGTGTGERRVDAFEALVGEHDRSADTVSDVADTVGDTP